jgi:hypothetical protein
MGFVSLTAWGRGHQGLWGESGRTNGEASRTSPLPKLMGFCLAPHQAAMIVSEVTTEMPSSAQMRQRRCLAFVGPPLQRSSTSFRVSTIVPAVSR